MPNFDGTGPLKRGRITVRDSGSCEKCSERCECQTNPDGLLLKEESPL
jgi:hypothetical protein